MRGQFKLHLTRHRILTLTDKTHLWKNKVAVVTGASSGIGKAAKELLEQTGVIVYNLDRNKPDKEHDRFILCEMSKKGEVNTIILYNKTFTITQPSIQIRRLLVVASIIVFTSQIVLIGNFDSFECSRTASLLSAM